VILADGGETSEVLQMHSRFRHILRMLGISTLAFLGCNYPNCPRTSIYETSERDFRLVAVADAISKFDERARIELESIGVVVQNVVSLLG